jgi:hypothetical protein
MRVFCRVKPMPDTPEAFDGRFTPMKEQTSIKINSKMNVPDSIHSLQLLNLK